MLNLTYCRLSKFKKTLKCLECILGTELRVNSLRKYHNTRKRLVLGIETSCDDTGAAVVDEDRTVLGDALNSQSKIHTDYGGIVPTSAQELHIENIKPVVQDALTAANITIQDVDAIAVTTEPGLALSLKIGLDYAKELVQQSGKPMIPIHHMEAHALTIRLLENVEFPYMVYLLSGGHCLLAIAKDVDDFVLLGTTVDSSPGECLDKIAREMNIKTLPECKGLPGGAAIELLAKDGDPLSFPVPHINTCKRNCDFSFTGLKTFFRLLIAEERKEQGLADDQVLQNVADICAACQFAIIRSLCRKLQRAFIYSELKGLLPEQKVLVASGGVASNMYFRQGLIQVCDMFSCKLICPPPELCTDNGIMIAWNGMEKLLAGKGIATDPMSIRYQPKSPLGEDIRDDVLKANIRLPKLHLKS